jgi:hypothetical protein
MPDKCVCDPSTWDISGAWNENYKCQPACNDTVGIVITITKKTDGTFEATAEGEVFTQVSFTDGVYTWMGKHKDFTETGVWTFSAGADCKPDAFTKTSTYADKTGMFNCIGAAKRAPATAPPVTGKPKGCP